MTTIQMPIEARLNFMLERVSDDATDDLRGLVDKVDSNLGMKEHLRQAQRTLGAYKDAVREGKSMDVWRTRFNLANMIAEPRTKGGLGFTATNSPEGKGVSKLPWHVNGMNQEARDKIIAQQVKSLESLFDSRSQSFSDLGQKLQFKLQEANNIYTRANKMRSDVGQKHDGALSGMARNLKG